MSGSLLIALAVFLACRGIIQQIEAPRRRLSSLMARIEGLREGRIVLEEQGWPRRLLGALRLVTRRWLQFADLEQLRALLRWADHPLGLRAEDAYFLRLGLLAAGVALPLLVLSGGTAQKTLGGMAIGAGMGYMLPLWWLRARVARRTAVIRWELPGFVHLVATALESGLQLGEAVRRVAVELPGVLSREMLWTAQEMASGRPAAAAWRELMERSDCQELREVLTAIVQSQEYGVPIAEQMRHQMRLIRQQKQQQARERAQTAVVKMRIPMVLLILFPTLALILGPAVMNLTREIGG